MTRQVVITEIAQKQFTDIVEYIQLNFGSLSKQNFVLKTERLVEFISRNPQLFPISRYKNNVRRCVLSKQTSMYYSFNDEVLTILSFFSNYQDPSSLSKYLS